MESNGAAWDPVSVLSDADREYFFDRWDDLGDLNVPGPFYTGVTDNCWTGRLHAPHNVIYGGKYFSEYVFRQPRDTDEVAGLVLAAQEDPFAGYASNGDEHWSPDAVRSWWQNRDRVVDSLFASLNRLDTEDDNESGDAAQGLRQFLSYLETGLEADLRAYIFRLETGRYPTPDQRLPKL
ncbi:hypothetical protein [Catenulispora rubra]|uniref:hypothetical protein n=1 Tax=Catenulispora rubra TaxID=280293 RepID=UPI0018921561|nr:hypothetical protein [Catenulispora rubra]